MAGKTSYGVQLFQGQRGGTGGTGGVDGLKSLAEVKLENLGYNSDRLAQILIFINFKEAVPLRLFCPRCFG